MTWWLSCNNCRRFPRQLAMAATRSAHPYHHFRSNGLGQQLQQAHRTGHTRRQAAAHRAATPKWLRCGPGTAAAVALFDPSSRASVLNFLPAANQWCTYGATAAETRVAPRLKKPLDSSTWAVPSL